MYLALLGFGMIVVFMALIMAKKLSPFTSLILIPIVFGLLAGYGWDTLEYAANGIINVASTFAMMTFAILYFGVMLPIYERLHIKKIYLATLIILQNCIMNLIPWGGPTARVMSVMNQIGRASCRERV